MAGRVSSYNKQLLDYVRANLLDPPAPKGSYKPDFDIKNPPWSKLGSWGTVYKNLQGYFAQYEVMQIPVEYSEFEINTPSGQK